MLAGDPQRGSVFRKTGGEKDMQPGGAEEGEQAGKQGSGLGVHRDSSLRMGVVAEGGMRYYASSSLNRG